MKKLILLALMAIISLGANAQTETSDIQESPSGKTITVKKTFYGSEFTGDWTNPCAGETLEQLATIKVEYKPTPKGYMVTAVMYDKGGRTVKAGYKFCEGTPTPDFKRYKLDNLMPLDTKDFPPLQN